MVGSSKIARVAVVALVAACPQTAEAVSTRTTTLNRRNKSSSADVLVTPLDKDTLAWASVLSPDLAVSPRSAGRPRKGERR